MASCIDGHQAEEARTRGTAVTLDNFKAWKAKFDKELAARKAKEEEEKLKGMTAKEREFNLGSANVWRHAMRWQDARRKPHTFPTPESPMRRSLKR